MRSLIDRLVDPGLERDQQIVAAAVGTLLGLLLGFAIVVGARVAIGVVLG